MPGARPESDGISGDGARRGFVGESPGFPRGGIAAGRALYRVPDVSKRPAARGAGRCVVQSSEQGNRVEVEYNGPYS